MKIKLWMLLIVLSGLTASWSAIATERQIFLVRHAEKQVNGTNDPALTPQGNTRANNIANQLMDKNIVVIYSSDYQRTRQTAAPLAKQLNLSISIYDPGDLSSFAEMLKQQPGNLLIVGHSNTTPQLAQLLGGKSLGKIKETEYNRIYQLTFDGKQVKTKLLLSTADWLLAQLMADSNISLT